MIRHLLDSSHGNFLPQIFAERYGKDYGLKDYVIDILALGPNDGQYWGVWDEVLQFAYRTDEEGRNWVLLEDEDLYEVCNDYESEEEE